MECISRWIDQPTNASTNAKAGRVISQTSCHDPTGGVPVEGGEACAMAIQERTAAPYSIQDANEARFASWPVLTWRNRSAPPMADQLPDSISPDLAYALRRLATDWLSSHGLVEARHALALAAQLAPASDSPEDLAAQLWAMANGERSLAPEPSPVPDAGASSEPAQDSPPEPTTAPAPKIKGQPPSRAKSAAA